MDRCRGCTVVLGPIESTLILSGCEDCLVVAPARRVIIAGSRRCTLHLLTPTRPLILQPPLTPLSGSTTPAGTTSCPASPTPTVAGRVGNEDIILAPYHTAYPDLRRHLEKAALDPNNNLWDKAFLFGKPNSGQFFVLLKKGVGISHSHTHSFWLKETCLEANFYASIERNIVHH